MSIDRHVFIFFFRTVIPLLIFVSSVQSMRGPLSLAPPRDSRLRFTPDEPYMTTTYPSVGGIVMGKLTAVQLKHLNISRFETSFRSSNAAEEDQVAFDLMRLGAHWFSSWAMFWRHNEAKNHKLIPYGFHFPPTIHVAFPASGGVWILKHSADRTCFDNDDNDDNGPRQRSLPEKPEGLTSALSLCLTMDERSLVLEKFGGTFFDEVSKCSDLPDSLQAGIQTGRDYDVLLRRMENLNYLDHWLEGKDIDLTLPLFNPVPEYNFGNCVTNIIDDPVLDWW